ncbi:MAG TPA: hypothetical protein VM577_03720, partial [Anaerovoracaceae bacterium]|nr:hypothetical protein [Anaerovoracaceae bacterium]
QAVTERRQAVDIDSKWGPGGTYRQILTAITAAASGNVSGSTTQFVESTVINYVQAKAAEGIKELTTELGIPEGSAAHTALHAITACAGAAAQDHDCGAAALGASSATIISALLSETQGDAQTLTNEQKEAREALIATLATGLGVIAGDAAAANTAALIEMENNSNVKNAVKGAINDAKAYLSGKAKEGGEKLVQLLEKLEIKPMVEMQDAIRDYLNQAATRGGLTDAEIAVLGALYAANEVLFPTSVLNILDVIPGGGKAIKVAGELIKVKVLPEEAAKIAATEMKGVSAAKSALPSALPEGLNGLANPNSIRFSQDSVANTFKNSTALQETIDALKSGKISPNDLPPIRVFEQNGVIYTLDNRRLLVASEAGVPIKITPATAEEIAKEGWKMTTPNNGTIICVRGICK